MFHLVFDAHDGRALVPISEEKREPVSDIDPPAVDSLKALDPERPISEADIRWRESDVGYGPAAAPYTAA